MRASQSETGRRLGRAGGVVACLIFSSGASGEQRTATSHVHGEMRLEVVRSGSELALSLHAPAEDILGFEHAPATEAELGSMTEARQALSDPLQLFAMDASCAVTSVTLGGMLEDHHEHGAAEGGDDIHADHADVEVEYVLTCTMPVQSITVNLFDHYAGVALLRVDAVTDSGASSTELSPSARTLVLQP